MDSQAGGPAPVDDRVGAAEVRSALDLTHHQLGELTAGLKVDVGERPNYPRYDREAVHQLTAVVGLRELRVPLEVAVRAVSDYRAQVLAGRGWLLTAPAEGTWTVGFVSTGPDLIMWLRASGGRGAILDLDRMSGRASQDWTRARSVTT